MTTHSWYILKVHAGRERQVAKRIRREADGNQSLDTVGRIAWAVESARHGSVNSTTGSLFPGYLVVELTMAPQTASRIRAIPEVIDFITGSKAWPVVHGMIGGDRTAPASALTPLTGEDLSRRLPLLEDLA